MKIETDLDFGKVSKILNALFQSGTTSELNSILTEESQIAYDSDLKTYKYYNGSSIQTLVTSGNTFINGGNSFSDVAILGTNDNEELVFRTNGVDRMKITTTVGDSIIDYFTVTPGQYYAGRTGTAMVFSSQATVYVNAETSFIRLQTESSTRMQIDFDGKIVYGGSSAFLDTDHSFAGSSNDSLTYNTQWQNSDQDVLAWVRNDGVFNSLSYKIGSYDFAKYDNLTGNFIIGDTPLLATIGTDNTIVGRGNLFTAVSYIPERITSVGGGGFINAHTFVDSVGIGYRHGFNNISGNRLMYVGPEAGYFNFYGSDQICIGRASGPISGADSLNGIITIASGAVVRQSNTAIFGSNDSPITRYVFGRGESVTTTFEDVIFTAHFPAIVSNQNAGGSIQIAPPAARGTGASGDVHLMYSPPVASGTTLQTYESALIVEGSTGNISFGTSAFVDTYFSSKSTGNSSLTYHWQAKNGDNDILGSINDAGYWFFKKGYRIGSYGSETETLGGFATIWGNSIEAHPTLNNTIIKTSNDVGHWIRIIYNDGISFHTNFIGALNSTDTDDSYKVAGFKESSFYLADNCQISFDYSNLGSKILRRDTEEIVLYNNNDWITLANDEGFRVTNYLKNETWFKVLEKNTFLHDEGAYFIGELNVDGSWRHKIASGDLVFEKRESGVWVEKYRIPA